MLRISLPYPTETRVCTRAGREANILAYHADQPHNGLFVEIKTEEGWIVRNYPTDGILSLGAESEGDILNIEDRIPDPQTVYVSLHRIGMDLSIQATRTPPNRDVKGLLAVEQVVLTPGTFNMESV